MGAGLYHIWVPEWIDHPRLSVTFYNSTPDQHNNNSGGNHAPVCAGEANLAVLQLASSDFLRCSFEFVYSLQAVRKCSLAKAWLTQRHIHACHMYYRDWSRVVSYCSRVNRV